VTIHFGFSGTGLIFNDVSQKEITVLLECPSFLFLAWCSGFIPDLPISAAVCLRFGGQKLAQILSIYTKNRWRSGLNPGPRWGSSRCFPKPPSWAQIHFGFSGTGLIFNDVSQKEITVFLECPSFLFLAWCSGFIPDLPISAAICLRFGGQKLAQILSIYTKNRWRSGLNPGPRWGAHDASPNPQVGPQMARACGTRTL